MSLPIWQRLQVQAQVSWLLLPGGTMTWRTWLFEPGFWLTLPDQPLTHARMPGGRIIGRLGDPAGFYWLSIALRVLGIDLGFGIFYRPSKASRHPVASDGEGRRADKDALASASARTVEPSAPHSENGEGQ